MRRIDGPLPVGGPGLARPTSKVQMRRDRAASNLAAFEAKRRCILAEAARIFLRDGSRNAQLQTIAARFSMSRAALYHYVSGKDELLTECMEMGAGELRRVFDDAAALPADGLARLAYVFHWMPRRTTNDFGRVVMSLRANELSPPLQAQLRELADYVLTSLQTLVECGVDDGSVRCAEPRRLAMALMSSLSAANAWHDAAEALGPDLNGRAPDAFGDAFFLYYAQGIAGPAQTGGAGDA